MSNVDHVEHYRQVRQAADALWERLVTAQDEAMKGRQGSDPHGVAFRQVDAEVRTKVARLWQEHDAVLSSRRS